LNYLCTAVFKSVETPVVSFSQFSVETL